jgi:hypothetical protein
LFLTSFGRILLSMRLFWASMKKRETLEFAAHRAIIRSMKLGETTNNEYFYVPW